MPDRTGQARPNWPGHTGKTKPDRTSQARPNKQGKIEQAKQHQTSQASLNPQSPRVRPDRTAQVSPDPLEPDQTEQDRTRTGPTKPGQTPNCSANLRKMGAAVVPLKGDSINQLIN